jgi:hypothetical protein
MFGPDRGHGYATGTMGIKFHCPNGHKLNVKAFLAGKKGVCPKCGTRLRIPDSSEPGLGDDDVDDSDTGKTPAGSTYRGPMPAPAATAAAIAPKVAEAQLPKPAPAPINARPTAAPQAVPTVAMPSPTAAMPGVMPGPVAATVPAAVRSPTPGDPIAEAPAAVWYVRPPSGGQFGPARGDVMRKWIAEGRVSSDSLVWRDGWTDWQTAGKLFPNLQSASAPAAATNAAVATPATTGISRATRTVSRYQAKKSGAGNMGVALLILLAIVCVALIAVLVYVLFNMQT